MVWAWGGCETGGVVRCGEEQPAGWEQLRTLALTQHADTLYLCCMLRWFSSNQFSSTPIKHSGFPFLKKGIHWKLFVKQNQKREKINNKKVIRYYFWVSRDSKQAYAAACSNKSLLIVVICLNELRLVLLALHTNVQTLYPACFYSSQKQQALSEALPFLQPAGNERPLWIAAECKTETTSAGSWTGTSAAWPPGALVAETAVQPPGNSCYAISHPPHSDTQILSMASGCIKQH